MIILAIEWSFIAMFIALVVLGLAKLIDANPNNTFVWLLITFVVCVAGWIREAL